MLKFTFITAETKEYVFRFYEERAFASVNYTIETSSVNNQVTSKLEFEDWICSVIGSSLLPNYLGLFQYLFQKGISQGNDFVIEESFIAKNCMSDFERDIFKAEVLSLNNEKFNKTGLGGNLNQLELIYSTRNKIEARLFLNKLNEDLRALG
jgi:hypothetical protein